MSQVNVEEWTAADKGNEVLHTKTDDDVINAVMKQNPENKNLQTKKSPQGKFLGLKLLTHILHF
jgi:putative lipoic acid-binding regulatory protein